MRVRVWGHAGDMHGDTDHRERTFLLSDLQGSTALHRAHPDRMLEVMDRHDAALIEIVAAHRGELFKNTGDGAWAAFDAPGDALDAAIAMQRTIPAIRVGEVPPLVVRIGIATGAARPRRGDYFGPALSRTARLEGAANGGQIVVDERTRELCAELATGHDLRDLGPHRFKGMEPMTVHQVLAADLGTDFGPLRGKQDVTTGNLPAALTSFVGRGRQLTDVRALLDRQRIVTLLGPGGTGKTRLSIEAARSVETTFDHGAWLVELSPLEAEHDVWSAFATTFALPPVPGATPRAQVVEHLRDRRCLLVVDNCEHVLEPIAEAILDLTQSCPRVVVLASSRRVLALPGEALVEVPPLDDSATDVEPSAAVQLFVDRARLVSPAFEPDADDIAAIEEICARLDHLPLAIEMAAANTRRLDLDRVRRQAERSIDLRASRHRRAIGRQQTMRGTLDWSYQLLEPEARDLLDRLAVFAGTFDDDLAIALCGLDDVDPGDVLDLLDELLDASLLARDPDDDERFRLLHVVRAYGRERLDADGRSDRLQRHHGETFAGRVAELGRRFDDGEEKEMAGRFFAAQPDLEAAFERALASDVALAGALTVPMFLFTYIHRGAVFGGWPARVLDAAGDTILDDHAVLCAMAAAHSIHADADPDAATRHLARGREVDPTGEASRGWLDSVAGQVSFWTGDNEASLDHHLRAIDVATAADNRSCAILSASLAAFSAGRAKRVDVAVRQLGVAEHLAAGSLSPNVIGYVNFAKGMLLAGRDPERALAELQVALDWARLSANPQGANRVSRVMADVRAAGAAPAEALEILANALVNFPAEGDAMHAWSTVGSLIPKLAALGLDDEVAVLTGALSASALPVDEGHDELVLDVRERLGADEFDAYAAEGRALGLNGTRRRVEERFATN